MALVNLAKLKILSLIYTVKYKKSLYHCRSELELQRGLVVTPSIGHQIMGLLVRKSQGGSGDPPYHSSFFKRII